MKSAAPTLPARFYSLDVLRGLAALGVVFWHWQHFFFQGTVLGDFDSQRQPLYWLLRPLYLHGAWAVPFFFCLSGFVFFWLYAEKIARGEVSAREFAVLRFSRLYPLHLVTLGVVLAGQMWMQRQTGESFVYPNNDAYHFVLNLLFVSQWGLQRGASFNGPVWSVSVEVLLYALFFIACRANWRRWWAVAILAGLGYALMQFGPAGIGRGISLFFVGGLSFQLFVHLWQRGISRLALGGMWLATVALWILVPLKGRTLGIFLAPVRELLFPITVVTLTLTEARRGTLGKRLAVLGDISYASYMLHFPLQLAVVIVAAEAGLPRTVFYSPVALVAFFAVLLGLALASYRWWERPAQAWLRARLRL